MFRHAGKELGRRLAQAHEGSDDEMRAHELISDFFKAKGFAQAIELNGEQATLHNCSIGLELARRGRAQGHHPLCYFGLGLVDGVNQKVTGKSHIALHVVTTPATNGELICQETW